MNTEYIFIANFGGHDLIHDMVILRDTNKKMLLAKINDLMLSNGFEEYELYKLSQINRNAGIHDDYGRLFFSEKEFNSFLETYDYKVKTIIKGYTKIGSYEIERFIKIQPLGDMVSVAKKVNSFLEKTKYENWEQIYYRLNVNGTTEGHFIDRDFYDLEISEK
tara:strand:+ start:1245 stop:1733 length:489 start_codon:yes stop_codon:yes gene_type:complete